MFSSILPHSKFNRWFLAGIGVIIWLLLLHQALTLWQLPTSLENRTISVTGYIATLPKQKEHYLNFVLQTETIADQSVKSKILLNWYDFYQAIKPGEKWQLMVRLKRPHALKNPGCFNYDNYLLENGISASGYVVNKNAHLLSDNWMKSPINRARYYLEQRINLALANQSHYGLVEAISVGDQSGISASEWQVLRATGTVHFVAIAGLHIGFLAGLIFLLTSFIWRHLGKAPLFLPAQKMGALCALFAAFIYSALAGFSLPTKRALIMLTTFMLTLLLNKKLGSWRALILSCALILFIEPLAILSSSFWLSFGAVFLIIYVLHGRLETANRLQKYCQMQWALTLGVMPLSFQFFGQASLISLIANSIAVPWIGFVVVPLSLSASLILCITEHYGAYLMRLALAAMQLIFTWLNYLSSLPHAYFSHAISSPLVLISALAGVLFLLAPRALPGRYVGILFFLPLFFYVPPKPKVNEIWFTLLDVGQGLAAVIETATHTIVYDTGPKWNDELNAGNSIIFPFLQYRGIDKIDLLVLSHADMDHRGGLASLMQLLPVKQLLTSVPELFPDNKIVTACQAGQSWQWDGVNFDMLYPEANSSMEGNNKSCVLHVSNPGGKSLLLPGDIEKPAEEMLAKIAAGQLSSTIVVAPHHGSDTSSCPVFIQTTQPKYVLFATGYLNHFHFPSSTIIAAYLKAGATLFNTAENGAIQIHLSDKCPKTCLK